MAVGAAQLLKGGGGGGVACSAVCCEPTPHLFDRPLPRPHDGLNLLSNPFQQRSCLIAARLFQHLDVQTPEWILHFVVELLVLLCPHICRRNVVFYKGHFCWCQIAILLEQKQGSVV